MGVDSYTVDTSKLFKKENVELRPPYPFEELKDLNKLKIKEHVSLLIKREFIKAWRCRCLFKSAALARKVVEIPIEVNYPTNIIKYLILKLGKKFRQYWSYILNIFRKKWIINIIYKCKPFWYILAYINILKSKEIRNFLKRKLVFRIYAHRVLLHLFIRSIPINQGVILSLIPFFLSAIHVMILKFRPHYFRYTLPLLSPPIQTIKWETLLMSDNALNILGLEKNNITYCGDHLLIRRNKEPKLFGNLYYKNYIFTNTNTSKRKKRFIGLREMMQDLDVFPLKMSSNRQLRPSRISLKRINKIPLSDQALKWILKKVSFEKNVAYFDFLVRSIYINIENPRTLWAIFAEYIKLEKARSRSKVEKPVVILNKKKPQIDKSQWDSKDYLVETTVDLPPRLIRSTEKKINFPILPNEDQIISNKPNWPIEYYRTYLTNVSNVKKIPFLIKNDLQNELALAETERLDEFSFLYKINEKKILKTIQFRIFSDDDSNSSYTRLPISDKRKISLNFLKNYKGKKKVNSSVEHFKFKIKRVSKRSKKKLTKFGKLSRLNKIELEPIKKLYQKNPSFINEYQKKMDLEENRFFSEDRRIFIKPRLMTGYSYPDSTLTEVRALKFYDFLTQFKKTTLIKIELPPNFSITSYIPIAFPEAPDTSKIKIATVKRKKGKKKFNDMILSNALESEFDPQEYLTQYEKEDLGIFGTEVIESEKLPFNYRGPGVVVTENNDIVLSCKHKYPKNAKYYLYSCRIPFDYYTGSSDDPNKNNQDIPLRKDYNIIREWLFSYLTPDNPLQHGTLLTNDIDHIKNITREALLRRATNNPDYQRLITTQFGHHMYRVKRKGFWKKWGVFPFRRNDLDIPTLWNSELPSQTNGILIGYSDDDWFDRTKVVKEFVFPIWREEVLGDYEELDNSHYERKRLLATTKGYISGTLPSSPLMIPTKDERPKFYFGATPEIDYTANPYALQFIYKIYKSVNNPHVTELIRGLGFGHQAVITTSSTTYKNKLFFNVYEPVTLQVWLYISYLAFGYLGIILVRQVAVVYSHEFLHILLDQLKDTGYLPPELRDELNIILGYKDAGFRIATEFKKGFGHIVGIEKYINQFVEIVLYLRGGIKNPDIAKNAQTVLLVGPPGTGKTILIQALAFEANVPVLTLTAQGAQEPDALDRLFKKARKLAPCIVFFDEIDNIGRKREGVLGFEDVLNDDFIKKSIREDEFPEMSTLIGQVDDLNPHFLRNKKEFNTSVNRDVQNHLIKKHDDEYYRVGILSRLLIELDGISSREGIVIIGATNRVDVLDSALLRPGRFNRHIRVSLPNREKRLQLFQFYTKGLGSTPDIPWDYLSKLTFGYSAADIAAIMNESCMKAILDNSIHSLESIEHGIDRLTTNAIIKPTLSEKERTSKNIEFNYYYSTVRGAYYQAGKALVGTLLKYHPPIIALHLWYRENSVRYEQIQLTTLVEWLRFVFRGELEHRIIGAFGGKAGEWVFLENLRDIADKSFISNMGAQEWKIAQALIHLLVDKWHMYTPHIFLLQEQRPLLSNFNLFVYTDVKEQFLYEFAQTFEASPKGINLLGFEEDKNPQTLFSLTWWQMKLQEHYLELELQKWYSLWLSNPEEWKFNPQWVSPDSTFHQNTTKEDIYFGTKYKDLAFLIRDYRINSIILEACNVSFLITTTYREILDQLAYELLHEGILREYQIYKIFENFGIDCVKLKEELNQSLSSAVLNTDLPSNYKILYHSWGPYSAKPTIRWIDIEAVKNSTTSTLSNEKEKKNLDNENIAKDLDLD